MRLSQIIDNTRYRNETELMFFHGTSSKWMDSFIKNGIRIVKLNKKKDFGKGFYLTTRYWQAKDYADRIAKATNSIPLIIACVIPVEALRTNRAQGLVVDEFNEEWLHTILRGRFEEEENPLSNRYGWIYGRCGDGHTVSFQEEFLRDEEKDYSSLLTKLIPHQENPHYEYDQLWLGTAEMIKLIKSATFINIKEGVVLDAKIPILYS